MRLYKILSIVQVYLHLYFSLRAVEMYAASKNYTKALELCVNHNISVTEEMAESLSVPKGEGSEEQRLAALDQIAEACFLQVR